MEKKFNVNGMSCIMCATSIEKGLLKLDGIESVQVHLMEKIMTVSFNDGKISVRDIEETVKNLGYSATEYLDKNSVAIDKDVKKLKNAFIISLIALLPLIYLSMGGMINLPLPNAYVNYSFQFIFSLFVIIINKKYIISGIKSIKNYSPNMDALVMMASALAFIYSTVVTLLFFTGVYSEIKVFFSASAMVPAIVDIGKWLEEKSKKKTGDAIKSLTALMPETVTVIKNGKEASVNIDEIKKGDTIIVKTGDFIPVDGEIIEGNGVIEKSAITGESMPEEVRLFDEVLSGSVLRNGYIVVKVVNAGEEAFFNKIIEKVKLASQGKAPVQKIADRVAQVFVPLILFLATVTFLVWYLITKDLHASLNYAISVTVISCPCALWLATPVAVTVAMGVAAKIGVLFKDAESIENTGKVNCVIFDKTATLTEGAPSVYKYINLSDVSDESVFTIISALEQKSNHPLANSIIDYCGKSDCEVNNFKIEYGRGISGEIDGIRYFAGNTDFISNYVSAKEYSDANIILSDKEKILAVFYVTDKIKVQSSVAIKTLQNMGIKTILLSGDNQSSSLEVSNALNINEYFYGVLPDGKAEIVQQYIDKGYYVAMVGDGINDSVALKSAHIGLAMDNGTSVAKNSANVILIGGNPKSVVNAVSLSRESFKIIKGNLFWAFVYNMLAIPIAAGVFSFLGITLTPVISSACMCLSSLFVVINALRINKFIANKGEKMKLKIDGMMCNHCAKRVKEIIENLGGKNAEINLKKKLAIFEDCDNETVAKIIDEINKAGYKYIKSIK